LRESDRARAVALRGPIRLQLPHQGSWATGAAADSGKLSGGGFA
jgi:hypothetical protein